MVGTVCICCLRQRPSAGVRASLCYCFQNKIIGNVLGDGLAYSENRETRIALFGQMAF